MRRRELLEYFDIALAQTSDGPLEKPRPTGRFAGCVRGIVSRLRIVTPDRQTFYLALLDADAFAGAEPDLG